MKAKRLKALINQAEVVSNKSGSRLTATRKQVLVAMLTSNKALSAYELVERIKSEFNKAIPTMSVYRILDVLISGNLVHKMSLVNKYIACSHITCSHVHNFPRFFICKKCSRVKEMMSDASTVDMVKENAEELGFQVISQQLEIQCLCQECA